MFRLFDDSRVDWIEIVFDDESVRVPAGFTLAAALFYLDALPNRYAPLSGSPRAPFCLMGACFDCLVEIEGEGRMRACQLVVREGLRARRCNDNRPNGGET